MKTSKPLSDLIPDIIRHIQDWKPNLEFNFRCYKLLEGQIRKEIEDSLAKELISKSAFNRAIQRIPSLNILKRTTDKLSKVYLEGPKRKTESKTDTEILEVISKESNINVTLDVANKLYNGLNSFALEPYIEEGKHKVRVLAPHQFLVYTDSKTNKSTPTVFIKFLGSKVKNVMIPVSKDGTRQDSQYRPELVDIYALYSDTEYMIIDTYGEVRFDIQEELGVQGNVNPFGRIPFVYGKKTLLELMPYPNQPGFDFSILIPKLLTDLNYAAQFCSHSITWTKNVKLNNQELNPDAIVDLGDTDADGANPEIGTITPSVDVQNQLSLIEFQFNAHLDSLGFKNTATGALSNGRDSSAISKAIDEGDISAEKKIQMEYFEGVEAELWSLIADMQRVWTRRADVKEKRVFTETFVDTFGIEFSEVKPLKSFRQTIEEVQLLKDNKLISRRQAIKMLYPGWSDSEVDGWIEELDQEAQDNMDRVMQGMESMQADQKSDGTFTEGNQVGGNQTIDSQPPEMKK